MNTIRAMALEDLQEVAGIHTASFARFFLSSLGAHFLAEFYRFVLLEQDSFAFVARDNGRALGFVAGTIHPANFYRRIFARGWLRLGLASALPIMRKPLLLRRIMQRVSATSQNPYEPDEALLMSIAVIPHIQGQGVGKQLLDAFLTEARRRGAASVSLTTDKSDNEAVNRFYTHAGFHLSYSFTTREGREMNCYVLNF